LEPTGQASESGAGDWEGWSTDIALAALKCLWRALDPELRAELDARSAREKELLPTGVGPGVYFGGADLDSDPTYEGWLELRDDGNFWMALNRQSKNPDHAVPGPAFALGTWEDIADGVVLSFEDWAQVSRMDLRLHGRRVGPWSWVDRKRQVVSNRVPWNMRGRTDGAYLVLQRYWIEGPDQGKPYGSPFSYWLVARRKDAEPASNPQSR